ncbi:HD domain-containing protein [Tothia fuscella]|uniref:5'-deoxynucleotidase n=1 Tax=Tothia fuscella TaxID=1048955 RepID=A0A9P4NWF6_9PEZI|nr:HD domain-containing protein [Tothia fuscella]
MTHDSGTTDAGPNPAPAVSVQDWTTESVLENVTHKPEPSTTSPVGFFHILERLKTTQREGWRRFGVKNGESISDHMYRMSIITMLAPPSLSSKLDIPRCTKMALIHDMAELLVGDITPVDKIPKAEKSRREETTMDYLCKDLLGKVGGGIAGEEMKAVWKEYEDGETLEAKFVHDVDKVELLLQMVDYERSNKHDGKGQLDLGEFCHVAERIELEEVKEWCDTIMKERDEYWKGVGKTPFRNRGT